MSNTMKLIHNWQPDVYAHTRQYMKQIKKKIIQNEKWKIYGCLLAHKNEKFRLISTYSHKRVLKWSHHFSPLLKHFYQQTFEKNHRPVNKDQVQLLNRGGGMSRGENSYQKNKENPGRDSSTFYRPLKWISITTIGPVTKLAEVMDVTALMIKSGWLMATLRFELGF